MNLDHLAWPFFDNQHRALAQALAADLASWDGTGPEALSPNGSSDAVDAHCRDGVDAHCRDGVNAHCRDGVDAHCRALVKRLGAGGWTRYAVPAAYGGALGQLDSRALCLIREALAYHEGLADFAFAMQGLGSGAISLAGSEALKAAYLPRVARGEAIAAFALTEPEAGSDVGAMRTSARFEAGVGGAPAAGSYLLNGTKTWISNGGIADFYCVFARSDPASKGARGISAFVVDADTPGLIIAERLDVIAPHPLATLRFDNCRVPATHLLGAEGQGFKLAMQNLDIFRASVAAAALGFARRAFDEAVARAKTRPMFGGKLADLQLTQAALGDMATMIDSAALLTYRAAWQRDTGGAAPGAATGGTRGAIPDTSAGRVAGTAAGAAAGAAAMAGERAAAPVRTTREAAMAKMTATENAQWVIDRALQMFGGQGVQSGTMVEKLYREIRALRIYEGATEVQKIIIGKEVLK